MTRVRFKRSGSRCGCSIYLTAQKTLRTPHPLPSLPQLRSRKQFAMKDEISALHCMVYLSHHVKNRPCYTSSRRSITNAIHLQPSKPAMSGPHSHARKNSQSVQHPPIERKTPATAPAPSVIYASAFLSIFCISISISMSVFISIFPILHTLNTTRFYFVKVMRQAGFSELDIVVGEWSTDIGDGLAHGF